MADWTWLIKWKSFGRNWITPHRIETTMILERLLKPRSRSYPCHEAAPSIHDEYACADEILFKAKERLVYEAICCESHWWMTTTTHWNVHDMRNSESRHTLPALTVSVARPNKFIHFSMFTSLSCISQKLFMEIYLQSTLNWISLRMELGKSFAWE